MTCLPSYVSGLPQSTATYCISKATGREQGTVRRCLIKTTVQLTAQLGKVIRSSAGTEACRCSKSPGPELLSPAVGCIILGTYCSEIWRQGDSFFRTERGSRQTISTTLRLVWNAAV